MAQKLTVTDVVAMRVMRLTGVSYGKIAKAFDISTGTCKPAIDGQTHKNVLFPVKDDVDKIHSDKAEALALANDLIADSDDDFGAQIASEVAEHIAETSAHGESWTSVETSTPQEAEYTITPSAVVGLTPAPEAPEAEADNTPHASGSLEAETESSVDTATPAPEQESTPAPVEPASAEKKAAKLAARAVAVSAGVYAAQKPKAIPHMKISESQVRFIRFSPLSPKELTALVPLSASTIARVRSYDMCKWVANDGPVWTPGTDATFEWANQEKQ